MDDKSKRKKPPTSPAVAGEVRVHRGTSKRAAAARDPQAYPEVRNRDLRNHSDEFDVIDHDGEDL